MCGRWLTRATIESCTEGVARYARMPTAVQIFSSKSAASACASEDGVIKHGRPAKRSESEWSMPIFSEPAMGCEPTKTAPLPARAFSHCSQTDFFTLPTSVITAPFLRLGAIRSASCGMFAVGAQITTMSASRTAASGESKTPSKTDGSAAHFSRVDSERDHAKTFSATPNFFKARASDAPSKPVPKTATVPINFIRKKLTNPRPARKQNRRKKFKINALSPPSRGL